MLFLTLLSTCVLAQTGDGIDDSNVTVISTFEARLTDASRVRVTPTPPAPDTLRVRQEYLIGDRPLTLDYPAPTIRPRGIQKEKLADAKNGYVSIGGGLPNLLYGDLSYDVTSIDNLELGLFARHLSMNNDGNVENQKSSDTDFGVRGAYLFDQGFAVKGGLGYNTKSRYYYGYNFSPTDTAETPLTFTDDQVRQRFSTFAMDASIFNGTRTVADIDYDAGLSFYIMDGNPAVRENNLDLHVGGTKWIDEDRPLDVKFRASFTSFKDTSTQNLNNLYFMPAFTTPIAGRVRLKIGANLTLQEDDFDVFPNISVRRTHRGRGDLRLRRLGRNHSKQFTQDAERLQPMDQHALAGPDLRVLARVRWGGR